MLAELSLGIDMFATHHIQLHYTSLPSQPLSYCEADLLESWARCFSIITKHVAIYPVWASITVRSEVVEAFQGSLTVAFGNLAKKKFNIYLHTCLFKHAWHSIIIIFCGRIPLYSFHIADQPLLNWVGTRDRSAGEFLHVIASVIVTVFDYN